MKHYLLTLAVAALTVGTAQAQLAPMSTTQMRKAQPSSSWMLNQKKAAPGLMKPHLNGTFTTLNRATRVDEVARDPKELSYQVYGDESQMVGIAAADYYSSLAEYGCVGFGFASAFNAATLARYGNNKISKIYFAAWNSNLTDGEVFILDYSTGRMLWSKKVDEIHRFGSGDTEVPINEVDCDYTLTGNEGLLMIGWSATAAQNPNDPNSDYVVMPYYVDNTGRGEGAYYLGKTANGGYYLFGSASEVPADNTGTNYETASAFILVQTEGEGGLKYNDVLNGGAPQVRASKRNEASQESIVYLTNMGLNSIASVGYTYEVDGKTQTEVYTPEEPIPFFGLVQMPVKFALADGNGRYEGKFTFTTVNGEADEYPTDQECSVSAVTMEDSYTRTPVIEEFTSNTCGWCPRGLLYMPKIAEATADKQGAVLIAIHTDFQANNPDPLTAESYSLLVDAYGNSLPSAMVNRETIATNFAALPEYAQLLTDQPVEARMKLASTLTGSADEGYTVTATTDLTFTFDAEAGNYGVAYVVTEDDINQDIYQLNYYATYYNLNKQSATDAQIQEYFGWTDEEMELAKEGIGFPNGMYWYTPTFDHVAVVINDVAGNTEASLLPAVSYGKQLTHTATFELPARTEYPINPENLQVAALLIDQETGVIVTGRQAKIGTESEMSAIDQAQNTVGAPAISVADGAFTVAADAATAQVYDAAGKLITSATVNGQASLPTFGKGVYVIRVVKDGNVYTQKAVF